MEKYGTSIMNNYNYSKVFLCVKPLFKLDFWSSNFICMPFNTYKEADDYYSKHYGNKSAQKCEVEYSTIMPVCKYIPAALQPMILNYKLGKLFINAQVENPKNQ